MKLFDYFPFFSGGTVQKIASYNLLLITRNILQ